MKRAAPTRGRHPQSSARSMPGARGYDATSAGKPNGSRVPCTISPDVCSTADVRSATSAAVQEDGRDSRDRRRRARLQHRRSCWPCVRPATFLQSPAVCGSSWSMTLCHVSSNTFGRSGGRREPSYAAPPCKGTRSGRCESRPRPHPGRKSHEWTVHRRPAPCASATVSGASAVLPQQLSIRVSLLCRTNFAAFCRISYTRCESARGVAACRRA